MTTGTAGYAENASDLIERYEAIPFAHKYRAELHLLPQCPTTVLDIGAGTGVDAAWFAERGSRVLAVEPVEAFREAGRRLHPSGSIEWLDDSLPNLSVIAARGLRFDLIVLSAVWMHLDSSERRAGMQVIASLLGSPGTIVLSLRHGAVPAGRIMYQVSAAETIDLARSVGLTNVLAVEAESIEAVNRDAGVTWSRLVFLQGARDINQGS